MAVGSDDSLTVWINGKQVLRDRRTTRGALGHEQAKVPRSRSRRGTNRVLIRCGNGGGTWQYAVAFSTPAEFAFLGVGEGGIQPRRIPGRESDEGQRERPARPGGYFGDLKGPVACTKCHAVGSNGGKVGPELSSVGAKYPRDELITAVLAPSAKIASGYEPTIFALNDGRVVSGIIKNEGHDKVEIQDSEAKVVSLTKDQIEERRKSDVSLMPNGLAQGLSAKDFADLIAYLETLKQQPPATK